MDCATIAFMANINVMFFCCMIIYFLYVMSMCLFVVAYASVCISVIGTFDVKTILLLVALKG